MNINDLIIIIRTVGERTTECCKNIIQQIVPSGNIHVVNEVPFTSSIKKSFGIGIDENKEWTLIIDADVLVRTGFINEIVEFAEEQTENTFVIQGLVFDKIFNVLRPAGNHLYRTTILKPALEFLHQEEKSLRPESGIINRMVDEGYKFIQKDFIAGLHDFEQEYLSIAKKCFVHAHKHEWLIKDLLPFWIEKAKSDLDFYAAMLGLKEGRLFNGSLSVDSVLLEEKCKNLIDKNIFVPKPALSPLDFQEEKINKLLASYLNDPVSKQLQEKVFPVARWNKESERPVISGKKIIFVAHGPNQINGPNIWLQRMLPELKKKSFIPKVIFLMNSLDECSVLRKLEESGIECKRVLRKNYTEENVINLLEILKADMPDVFIPNLSVPAYYAVKWVKQAGIPTIGIIRSDDNFHYDLIDYFISGKEEYQLSGVVCKSEFLEKLVISKNTSTKVLRTSSGTFFPQEVALRPQNELKLIYTGRLVQRQKRIFDVINSVKKVVDEIPETSASFYGRDMENGNAIQAIENLNLGDRLSYNGIIEFDNLYKILCQNHVFVLLSEYEGMSTSLMEAMACGLVPICTKIRSGSSEIIKHNENGLFVDNTEDDFLNAVYRLKNEKGLWERLSANARKTIKEEYTIEISADRWTNFLNELISENKTKKDIQVPSVESLALPPLKFSDYGICREDNRMSLNGKEDQFLNLQLTEHNIDLYLVRNSIKKSIVQNLPLFKGLFLDIGCGEMPYRDFILSNQPAVTDYIGMDIESPFYQKTVRPDIFWDGNKIPLDDNFVDCVMATEVFEHVPDIESVLKEIKRVLKPNGILFFTVPFIWPLHDTPYDEYRYTPFSLKRHFENSGFNDLKLEALGGWNASLAQMLGLWLKRSPLAEQERENLIRSFYPFYKKLIETDVIPTELGSQTMYTGLSGVAYCSLKNEDTGMKKSKPALAMESVE